MWVFICKYWLEFLFGLIALALGAVAKYYYNLVKTGRATKKEKEKEPIFEEMKKLNQQLSDEIKENNIAFKKDLEACHCALKEEIKEQNRIQEEKMIASHEKIGQDIATLANELEKNNQSTEAVKSGTLALWRKTYFHDARMLLEKDHIITDEEYVKISVEHDVYNKLGGNHEGDQYFISITQKYHNGLKNG